MGVFSFTYYRERFWIEAENEKEASGFYEACTHRSVQHPRVVIEQDDTHDFPFKRQGELPRISRVYLSRAKATVNEELPEEAKKIGFWGQWKRELWDNTARRCFFCEKTFEDSDEVTRDHLWPRSLGGKVVVPACYCCNQRKADRMPTKEELLNFELFKIKAREIIAQKNHPV